jgi:hypothetical protein
VSIYSSYRPLWKVGHLPRLLAISGDIRPIALAVALGYGTLMVISAGNRWPPASRLVFRFLRFYMIGNTQGQRTRQVYDSEVYRARIVPA